MLVYTAPFVNIATNATADTWHGILGLQAPDTADADRFKLLAFEVFPSQNPAGVNVLWRIRRATAVTGDGTPGSTIAAADVPKVDPQIVDSRLPVKLNYGVLANAPTGLIAQPLVYYEHNDAGGMIKQYRDFEQFTVYRDGMLYFEATSETAGAVNLCGQATFGIF